MYVTAVAVGQSQRPTALFWCQNLHRELSQLPLRQLGIQRGQNLFQVTDLSWAWSRVVPCSVMP
jgi:hypothetical protein